MTLLIRRLIILALGLIAGLTAWPAMELLVSIQAFFPSMLLFTAVSGAIFGLFYGAVFSSAEGIISAVPRRIYMAAMFGAAIGILGGAAGLSAGQGTLFLVSELFAGAGKELSSAAHVISRAVGWGVFGLFVGSAEGIRARSGLKVWVGIAGGFLGGLLGGAALEYARVVITAPSLARFVGMAVYGVALAGAYASIENRLSKGSLRLLNGRNKGKELILNQRRILLGSSSRNDVVLANYKNVAERHAVVIVSGRDLHIEPASAKAVVIVNDQPVKKTLLKNEDVIKLGSARLIYRPV